ncbi:MAG TPA: ABC transporter permease [Candidatus Limnocylindrales bacterium]|nr:ABC transporter permease [Candidatus Limnocylindrales bacterium]
MGAAVQPADAPAASSVPVAEAGRLDRLRAAAFLLPGVGWLVLFFVLPLALIFVVSLGSRDPLGRISLDVVSLDNYAKAFDPVFLPTFLNSLKYATVTTILSLAIGYPIAYWISRYGGRHKVLLIILVMLPFWTSYLIRTYSWMILLRDNGVVNSILRAVGLTSEPIILMNTDISVILGMTYGFLPFAILPLFVSIDRLDPDLVAAGRDLYASGRSAFLHVTLPLTMPGIVAAGLLTFIPALGDFVTPDLLGGPETTTIAKNIQELFLAGRDWPYGSALGFVLMIVTLSGTLLALRTLRREVIGGE